MIKILKLILFSFFIINIFNIASSKEEYFKKGLELSKNKKYDDAKFMFEKSIDFNPKNWDRIECSIARTSTYFLWISICQ